MIIRVTFELAVLLIGVGAWLIFTNRAKQGKIPKIRKIAGLEGLSELVGRAAEMGKTVHIATGSQMLETSEAPIVTAGYAMLGYIAKLCGKYGVKLRYTCTFGYNIAIGQDLIKAGYTAAGAPGLYRDDMVYYAGDHQQAYSAAIMGYIMRERPAANMMFGGIKYETINSLGAGAVAGCMQAAGTPRWMYQPFLVAACDYSMIGDELFAAVALTTENPMEIGSIRGQDVIKVMALVLTAGTAVLALAGWNYIKVFGI